MITNWVFDVTRVTPQGTPESSTPGRRTDTPEDDEDYDTSGAEGSAIPAPRTKPINGSGIDHSPGRPRECAQHHTPS